jgi:hypothetical protein
MHYSTAYYLSQPRMPAPAPARVRSRRNGSFLSRARKAFAAR